MDNAIFDTRWHDIRSPSDYRNHGKEWSNEDKRLLVAYFGRGDPLSIMCSMLGRTKQGVIYGLRCAGLIYREPNLVVGGSPPYLYYKGSVPDQPPSTKWVEVLATSPQPETFSKRMDDAMLDSMLYAAAQLTNSGTTDMNTQATIPTLNDAQFTVTTRTYIGDVNAATLTDQQIYSKIAEIETHAAALKNIKNKPDSLKAYLLKLLAMALALGQYVDNRNAK